MKISKNLFRLVASAIFCVFPLSGFGFGFGFGSGPTKLPETKSGEKVTIFDRGDEIIRLFYGQSDSPPMDRDQVLHTILLSKKSKFQPKVADAKNERDVFQQEERLNAVYKEYLEYAAREPIGTVVALILPYTVSPYDMQKKEFRVCVDGDCSLTKTKVALGDFQFVVNKVNQGAISFSPPENIARDLEHEFVLDNRMGWSVVYAHIIGIETGKPNRINLRVFRVALKRTGHFDPSLGRLAYDYADDAGILFDEKSDAQP